MACDIFKDMMTKCAEELVIMPYHTANIWVLPHFKWVICLVHHGHLNRLVSIKVEFFHSICLTEPCKPLAYDKPTKEKKKTSMLVHRYQRHVNIVGSEYFLAPILLHKFSSTNFEPPQLCRASGKMFTKSLPNRYICCSLLSYLLSFHHTFITHFITYHVKKHNLILPLLPVTSFCDRVCEKISNEFIPKAMSVIHLCIHVIPMYTVSV